MLKPDEQDAPSTRAVKGGALLGIVSAAAAACALVEWDDATLFEEESVLLSKKGGKIIAGCALAGVVVGSVLGLLPTRSDRLKARASEPASHSPASVAR